MYKRQAQEGSFSTGYEALFETVGSQVTISFTLLDTDKTGVVAYLRRESPFEETQMDQVSGLTFSKTINGFSPGQTISYACKFAFAGGLAVTRYFSYVVGSICSSLGTDNFTWSKTIKLFPNPTVNVFSIDSKQIQISKVEIYSIDGKKLKDYNMNLTTFNIEDLSSGLYLVKIYSEEGMSTIKKLAKK